jgi:hypothetical protein
MELLAQSGTDPAQFWMALLTLGGVFLTTVASIFTAVFSAWKEDRNREWAEEDRKRLEEDKLARKKELTEQTLVLTQTTANAKHALEKKIDEGAEVAAQAFNAANNFNAKLVDIQKQIVDARRSGVLTKQQVEQLQQQLKAMAGDSGLFPKPPGLPDSLPPQPEE